jgi:catechol 2,3-dioxygenase-like lactoylglutathione lyase family enzyme
MSNVHIHHHVSNLEASRAFYERFLGAEPVKVKPGYVKFLPAFAPINLALSAGEAGAGEAGRRRAIGPDRPGASGRSGSAARGSARPQAGRSTRLRPRRAI